MAPPGLIDVTPAAHQRGGRRSAGIPLVSAPRRPAPADSPARCRAPPGRALLEAIPLTDVPGGQRSRLKLQAVEDDTPCEE